MKLRDLTEEELKLAPEWATHYFIDTDVDDEVIYESVGLCWWKGLDSPIRWGVLDDGARLLPRKPFNIAEYEFGDLDLSACKDDGSDDLQIYVSGDGYDVSATVYKQDVITMAKALGVTAEDLRV